MKKNILGLIMGFMFTFSLIACGNDPKADSNSNTPGDNGGTQDQTEEKPVDKSFVTPEIIGDLDPSTAEANKVHFNDSMKINGPFADDAFPAIGTPKMLVIPVNFDDSKKTDKNLNDIKIAFAGTEEQTGWESVKSYYYKSSYQKLNIDFVFTDWFTPTNSASYYETYTDDDGYDGSMLLVKEALNFFDDEYDFNDFDYDGDDYIDNVWLIYNHAVDYKYAEFWWAYQDTVYYDDVWDGVNASRYGFAGTDFMNPANEETSYDTTNIKVDAHTYIHESGHIMGLEDYYDYDLDNGPTNRGLFGADMMDSNIGDHSSFNKLSLGWVDPTVVSGKGKIELTLNSFTTTGEFLMLANHELDTIWDEYFLIEFYTNDGLNSNDQPILDDEGNKALGIRILHVDAKINYDAEGNVVENGDESYVGTGFKYDNSGTTYPLIEMLRADYGANMEECLYPESLYTEDGQVFGEDTWTTFKLNDGKKLFFTLTVKKIENNQCVIEINIK